MCEGLMELAKKIHIYLDRNSAATEKKMVPILFQNFLAQKYEGKIQFSRSGTINFDALIPVNSADLYAFKTRLWNYSSIM